MVFPVEVFVLFLGAFIEQCRQEAYSVDIGAGFGVDDFGQCRQDIPERANVVC